MIRIAKILVLLVFSGVATGTLLVPDSADAAFPTQLSNYEVTCEVEDLYCETSDGGGEDCEGDPDSLGDGLGANGSNLLDGISDFDSTGLDPEDADYWEALLDYLLSLYFLNL